MPCQAWLKMTALQVSQGLLAAANTSPTNRLRSQVLTTLAGLCVVFTKDESPYGILVGYSCQTGTLMENHSFTDESGRVMGYIMPKIKPNCKAREDQFVDIAKQGLSSLVGTSWGVG